MTADRPGRVLLVSSSGGVLLELLALRPWWSRHDVRWAAAEAPDTESVLDDAVVQWVPELSARQPLGLALGLARGVVRSVRLLRRERIELIVSAGTGVAVPFFVAATLVRIPSFWVQTLNVTGQPGIAARICARLATRVLVQRPEQLAAQPDAILIGELY